MYSPSMSICEPFLLKAEHILEIIKIIENRRPDGETSYYDPIFEYSCFDDRLERTTDINSLLNESNGRETRITSLKISGEEFFMADSGSQSMNYKLTFNSYEHETEFYSRLSEFTSISLEVVGEDIDSIRLLYNDLKKYLLNNVVSQKYHLLLNLLKYSSATIMALILLAVILITPTLLIKLFNIGLDYNTIITNALNSSDINVKVDALLLYIKDNVIPNKSLVPIFWIFIFIFFVAVISFILFIFREVINKKIRSLYPFIFDFGTNKEDYAARVKSIKIIVGLIGTILLGMVGNMLFELLKHLI